MISTLVLDIANAVQENRATWFPFDMSKRKRMNLKLGRGLGYGLAAYDDYEESAKTSYGKIIVKNSLDITGVAIDADEWLAAIREGADGYFASLRDADTPT